MMEEKRFAILVDGDNISQRYVKTIIEETAKFGLSTYRRVYGDWTDSKLSSWKDVLLKYSFNPMQQYSYTVGKNSTDSFMIIDAMDILYSGNVEGFVLVSSDSDFTRLATRLRESGMVVVGMGETKTPEPFTKACSQFKYLDLLNSNASQTISGEQTVKKPSNSNSQQSIDSSLSMNAKKKATIAEIRKIVEDCSDDEGWILASELGNQIQKNIPDFDPRNFKFKKLVPFIESIKDFETKKVGAKGKPQQVYVKIKDA